jgi:N-acetyltransferase
MFDFQPTLSDDHFTLRPLCADDWDAVFAAASDPLIWELHPVSDRHTEVSFRPYFAERLTAGGTLVIVERATGKIVGWSSYGNLDETVGEVEIGWTFLIRDHWGGPTNRHMKQLMLGHAFQFVNTVVFRIGENNVRSRRAVEKIGGVWNGRMTTITVKGVAIPHCVYAITQEAFSPTQLTETVAH